MESVTNELLNKYSKPDAYNIAKMLIEDKEIIKKLCWEMINYVNTIYFE